MCIVIAIIITIIVIAVLGNYYSNKRNSLYQEQYQENYNNTRKDTITPPKKENLKTNNTSTIPSVKNTTGMTDEEFYNMLENN